MSCYCRYIFKNKFLTRPLIWKIVEYLYHDYELAKLPQSRLAPVPQPQSSHCRLFQGFPRAPPNSPRGDRD